jgi:glycosyltransferase involved in cell wall biosynthesis
LTAYQTVLFLKSATSRTGPLAQIVYDYEHWASGDAETRSEIKAALGRQDVGHIATSLSVRQMLELFGAPVLATVNPAISMDRFKCARRPGDRELSIGFCFRSEPYKGIDDLIAALELVHSQWPNVPVRCYREVGAAQLPRWIERVGYLTDDQLVAFYNDCAIFVLPSHYEGWGLPAAEAMACGAALVTTDSGGPSDFVEPGQNALMVPPKNPVALASAITRLLIDEKLRLTIAATGAARASDMTWELNAERTEAALRTLLERRDGSA